MHSRNMVLALTENFPYFEGVPEKELFQPIDLFEKKNLPRVLNCLRYVAGSIQKEGFTIPWPAKKTNVDFSPKVFISNLLFLTLEGNSRSKKIRRSKFVDTKRFEWFWWRRRFSK
jgi:hypothetical protein